MPPVPRPPPGAARCCDLATSTGLLFIVEGSCSVCVRAADVLLSAQRQYGFALLTVSLDGEAPAGLQLPVRADTGQARKLGVVGTPALFLMRPPDAILPLAQGALDLDTLTARVVDQAHAAGWIDDAAYAATRAVRQPFAVPEPDSLASTDLADAGAARDQPAPAAGPAGSAHPRPVGWRPAVRRALRTAVLCLAVLSLLPVPAVRADLQEMMDEQFTALTNYTGPASFQTTRRAALTGGGVYTRVPIMSRAPAQPGPALARCRLQRHRLLRRQLLLHQRRPVHSIDEGHRRQCRRLRLPARHVRDVRDLHGGDRDPAEEGPGAEPVFRQQLPAGPGHRQRHARLPWASSGAAAPA